jgi:hypothetical protein
LYKHVFFKHNRSFGYVLPDFCLGVRRGLELLINFRNVNGYYFQSIKVYTSTASRFYLLLMPQLHIQRVMEVRKRQEGDKDR